MAGWKGVFLVDGTILCSFVGARWTDNLLIRASALKESPWTL